MTDIIWYAQLIGRDKDKTDIFVAHQRVDQGMYGSSEFQIPAKTYGDMVKASFQGANGHQIGESLCRVLMSAVSRVDNRNGGVKGSD